MRLFKSPTRFFSRGKPAKAKENETIGSEISSRDQFDIIIPLKQKQTWSFMEGNDNSTVSSLTTDDRRHPIRLRDKDKNKDGSKSSSLLCCTTHDETYHTENTLVEQRQDNASSCSSWRSCCCFQPPSETREEEIPTIRRLRHRGTVKRGSRSVSGSSLNRNNSLFDTLAEEEEETRSLGRRVKGMKRSFSRAMPWRARRQEVIVQPTARQEIQYIYAQE